MKRAAVAAALVSALLAAYVLLLRRRLDWDEIAFLLRIRGEHPDLLHPLYPPLLRAWSAMGEMLGLAPELAGKALSAVAAAGGALVLRALLLGAGVAPPVALLGALLYWTCGSAFVAATSVEVYAPGLFFLLLAWRCAQRRAAAAGPGWLVAAGVSLLAAAGFHPANLLGAVGVVALAHEGGGEARRRWKEAGALAAGIAGSIAAGAILAPDAGKVLSYAKTFLTPEGLDAVPAHLVETGRFLAENEPLLAVAGGLGLGVLLIRDRGGLAAPLALALPFLLAYAALGVPQLGLFLPALLGLVLAAALATRSFGAPRAGSVALALVLSVQLAVVLPLRWEEAKAPDARLEAARTLDALAPPGAAILADDLAMHLRWVSKREVISLAEELHGRHEGTMVALDAHVFVRAVVEAQAASGRRVYITRTAGERVHEYAKPLHPDAASAYEALRPLIDEGDVRIGTGGDPDLRLYLLRAAR